MSALVSYEKVECFHHKFHGMREGDVQPNPLNTSFPSATITTATQLKFLQTSRLGEGINKCSLTNRKV